MANVPLVSVLMPVRNEAAYIRRSLGAVLAQDYPAGRMEVIVADGHSTDGTREIIAGMARQYLNVALIENPERIVATGLNAAICVAKGEIIVRVDGHCEIAPDYVSRCVSTLREGEHAGVGGVVETVGETSTARAIAAAMSSWFGVGGSAFRLATSKTQVTDTVAFPAYTRSVINRAGPFDEELVRNQDDEYNYRLRKLGVKVLLAADVHSRYYSRATLPGLWRQYFQYGYWKVRVLQKHPRQMRLRQFAPPLFVAALLITLMLAATFPAAVYLLGLIGGGYVVAVFAASILSARKNGWELLPILPIAFAVVHLAYGSGFLMGLLKFWNRWAENTNNLKTRATIREHKYERHAQS